MKRLFLTIVLCALFVSPAFGASVTIQKDEISEGNIRHVVIKCVGDIDDTLLTVNKGLNSSLKGWQVVRLTIKSLAADDAVTDDSDVYLKDANGVDLLNDEGKDGLDDSTTNHFRLSYYDPIVGPPNLSVDNQAEAAGTYYLYFVFGK